MKTCSKCKAEKGFDQFSKDKQKGDGYCSTCRECAKTRVAAYRVSNPDKVKVTQANHYSANRERRIADVRAYREANPETVRATNRMSWERNSEKYRPLMKAWRDANKDRIKALAAAYYAANGATQRLRINEYRRLNPELARQRDAEKRIKNPAVYRAQDARRRARKLAAGGSYTAGDVDTLMGLQQGKCAVCRCALGRAYHVDHIVALARGGSNDRLNLQLLCKPCNLSKSAQDPITFMQSRGFLL